LDIDKITGDDQLGTLLQRAGEIKASLDAAAKAKDDGEQVAESVAELKANYDEVRKAINEWQTAENERTAAAELTKIRVDLDALMAQTRTASKAGVISAYPRHAAASADNFFATLARAKSRDYTEQIAGKGQLAEMGSHWADPDPAAKATVGDTDGAGGYLIPNPVVAEIDLQATPYRSVVNLATVVNGVNGSAVDIPWEQETISRAVIAAAGATKENSDFIVNNYTATLYTLARIFDVGNQLLRQSGGAAERLVRSKLARAFGLGEDYYFLSGSGSSQPYGLLTAIGTSGPYVTSFTPSATTLAGSVPTALATLAGVVANRGAIPDGAVLNSADYWVMLAQGTDTAGFFLAPAAGPNAINATNPGVVAAGPFGIRLAHSPNMTTDNLVVGEFSDLQFFRGQGYRVDTSDQAGTRWDKNLTGFRGEEEIAFDARPSVYTGHFQRVTNLLA
jgi:HK97 family phage major capsid protein